jgi:hypothetical protein
VIRRPVAAVIAGLSVLMATSCSSPRHSASSSSSTSTTTTRPVGSTSTAPAAPAIRLQAIQAPWALPAPVSRPVVLPDGAGFVVLGGLATGDVSTSRIVQVDPVSGQSVLAGRLALAVHDSAGAVINGEWFVFGGGSYSTVSEVQAWTSGTATAIGHLPDSRSDLSTAVAGTTTYVAGGFDGTAMTPDVLATTDGVSFHPVAQLAVPVRYAAVGAIGGALWVVGGVTSTSEGGTAETDAVQRVDLATGRVAVVGHLPQALGHAAAMVIDGQMFVLGGRSGATASATIWRLDPASGTVSATGQLPTALSDAGSVVVGDKGYLVGGEVTGPAQPLDSVIELSPTS